MNAGPTLCVALVLMGAGALDAAPADEADRTPPASMPASHPSSQPSPRPSSHPASRPARPPTCGADDAARLQRALDQHPVVDIARADADALRARGRQEAAWSDPSAFIEARGLPLTEPWNMGRTPMGGVAMGIAGKVPWLPRRWALDQARGQEADAALVGVAERQLDLSASLLQWVIDDELLEARARIHEDRVGLLTSLSDVARANAMVGAGGQTDAILLEAKAAQAQSLVAALAAQRRALRSRWAGVAPQTPWPTCRIGDGAPLVSNDDDDDALSRRPLVRALDERRRAAATRRSAALQSWIPEPTLKAAYVWRPDYGGFDGIDFLGGMVSIPLPLSPGKRLGSLEGADAAKRRIDAERRAFLLHARGEQQALRAALMAEAQRLHELEGTARPVAVAASEVAQATYAAGRGGVAAIVEAERLVLDLDLAIAQTRARQATLRVKLWRVQGGSENK
jgi:outer membrane protein TolC